ncbi:MAG: hypothetical protein H6679_03860 [Epsilonproteobacteria bacterium]|nr:hypothetical protein [Campylobacterota bacterium]
MIKMSLVKSGSFLLLVGLVCFCPGDAEINFGNTESSLVVKDNSFLRIREPNMLIEQGRLEREPLSQVIGHSIRFNNGVFASFNAEGLLNGVFRPARRLSDITSRKDTELDSVGDTSRTGNIEIGDNPDLDDADLFISNPGGFRHKVIIKSGANFLRGQPVFFGTNDLVLEDDSAGLFIAIQNALNTDITLNGGTVFLQDDLSLGDDAKFLGDGQVVLNNRRLSIGGTETDWEGQIIWNSALDIQLNSRVNLRGEWFFFGDGQINGNGNVIDIAEGGAIIVFPGSRLRMSGVVLKGVGTGELLLGEGSQLRLSNVAIEMNTSYLVNSGGIFVDGETNVLTRDNFLIFDQEGSLTVDRVALTYDALDFIDQFNIRPLRIEDPNHKFIEIINNGSIRRFRVDPISFVNYSQDAVMDRYELIWPTRKLRIFPEIDTPTVKGMLRDELDEDNVRFDLTIDGNTNYISFSRADEPLMFISDNVNACYKNTVFKFSPRHVEFGQDATLTFDDGTTVELARNEELDYEWTFSGKTILNGGGNDLTLGVSGAIVVTGQNSELMLDGLVLRGIAGNNIRCLDPSSKIILRNVKWLQDDIFEYSVGALDILDLVTMSHPIPFRYLSNQPLTILQDSTILLTRDTIFEYAPASGLNTLFQLVDSSAALILDGASLLAPQGLFFERGRIVVGNRNLLFSNDPTVPDQAITFGDEVILIKPSDATLEPTAV